MLQLQQPEQAARWPLPTRLFLPSCPEKAYIWWELKTFLRLWRSNQLKNPSSKCPENPDLSSTPKALQQARRGLTTWKGQVFQSSPEPSSILMSWKTLNWSASRKPSSLANQKWLKTANQKRTKPANQRPLITQFKWETMLVWTNHKHRRVFSSRTRATVWSNQTRAENFVKTRAVTSSRQLKFQIFLSQNLLDRACFQICIRRLCWRFHPATSEIG